VFLTLDEAYVVLPNFGPNPLCFGDGRCRCRLVPVIDKTGATPIPAREPREVPLEDITTVRTNPKTEKEEELGARLETQTEIVLEQIRDAVGGDLLWDTPPIDLVIRWGHPGMNIAEHRSRAAGWADPGITMHELYSPRLTNDFRATLLHEIGHWLDTEYFGRSSFFDGDYGGSVLSFRHPDDVRFADEMADLMRAISESDHVALLRSEINRAGDVGTARYRLRPREAFARAFVQWVAEKTGDEPLLDHIQARLDRLEGAYLPWYWQPDDFSRIYDEFERLFARARDG
jgi:hypothetical protein